MIQIDDYDLPIQVAEKIIGGTKDVPASSINDIKDKLVAQKGQWIEESTYMECPNCHDIWHYEKNQTERFKFCPTCGERIK